MPEPIPTANSGLFMPDQMPPEVVLPPAMRREIAKGKAAFDAQFAPPPPLNNTVKEEPPTPPPLREPERREPERSEPEPSVEEPRQPPIEEPAAEAISKAEYDRLLAAHTTLLGKYNAEVPAFAARLADVSKALGELRAEQDKKILTLPVEHAKEDVETYGTDLLDVINRSAAAIVQRELADIRGALKKQNETLDTVNRDVGAVVANSLHSYLDRELPEWRTVDVDPKFTAWLQAPHPLFGVPMSAALANARDTKDYPRVKSIFMGYLDANGPKAQPNKGTPSPNGKDTLPKVKLDTLVAPDGRRRAGAAPQEQAPEVPASPDEIKAFYRDKIARLSGQGPLVGWTEAEIADMETQIHRRAIMPTG